MESVVEYLNGLQKKPKETKQIGGADRSLKIFYAE
jgi:hypothetical protein